MNKNWGLAPAFVFLSSCMSAQNHGVLQELENAMQSNTKNPNAVKENKDGVSVEGANGSSPIIEIIVEYFGAPEGWSGPKTLTLHVMARDGFARIAKKWSEESSLIQTGQPQNQSPVQFV